jgi:murein DD-endopeptidase MepM/ murein hydrolase activator NlpD
MIESSPTPTDTEIASAARGRFLWPVRGEIISGFGVKGVGRRNDGLDIRAPQGTLVRSAAGGEVVYAGDQVPGFGNLVLIKHTDGWVTAYAHLDRVSVQMRQQVSQGQELGQVGLSGGVTEPQLHFEVRYAPTPADKAKPVDPVLVLPRL